MKRDIVLINSHTKERGERISFAFFFLGNFVLCVFVCVIIVNEY